MRTLTPAMVAALEHPVKHPVAFVESHFISDVLRLWSGTGVIFWNGHEWLGTGRLGEISEIEETTSIEAPGIKVQLRGIKKEDVAVALTEVKQGNPVEVWMGFRAHDDSLIADPASVYYGGMDVPIINEEGDTVSIAISVESRMTVLNQKKQRRRTHEDQQIRFPQDEGLAYVTGIQGAQIVWQ